jgi:hypothetical protein
MPVGEEFSGRRHIRADAHPSYRITLVNPPMAAKSCFFAKNTLNNRKIKHAAAVPRRRRHRPELLLCQPIPRLWQKDEQRLHWIQ